MLEDVSIERDSAVEIVLRAQKNVEQIYVFQKIVGWHVTTESVEINAFTNIPSAKENVPQNMSHAVTTNVFVKESLVVTSPVEDIASTKAAGQSTTTSHVEIDVFIGKILPCQKYG